jgi:hypothetical protein
MRLSSSARMAAFVALPAFGVGLLAGRFVRTFQIVEVRYQISAGEILNAAVTVVIAVLIADYLSSRAATVRVEKDILLQDCGECLAAASVARDLARKSRRAKVTVSERRTILPLLGDAFAALERLETDVSFCKGTVGTLSIAPLKDALVRYKAALTGGPFPGNPLDDETYLESERKFAEFSKLLASIRFELNRR